MTPSCLVRSLTQTHLAASLLPSVIDLHTTAYTQTHTLTHAHPALHAAAHTNRHRAAQCSHARLLADRDKPLFHSLIHPHRYTHTQAGKPEWGDIKEHALLPVKLYCTLAHNEYKYMASADCILNTGCLSFILFISSSAAHISKSLASFVPKFLVLATLLLIISTAG